MNDDQEIALVAIDRLPELSTLVLYELYVLQSKRRRGFGNEIMKKVDSIARIEGFKKIRLIARLLDKDIGVNDLKLFYYRRGYTDDLFVEDEMEKCISAGISE